MSGWSRKRNRWRRSSSAIQPFIKFNSFQGNRRKSSNRDQRSARQHRVAYSASHRLLGKAVLSSIPFFQALTPSTTSVNIGHSRDWIFRDTVSTLPNPHVSIVQTKRRHLYQDFSRSRGRHWKILAVDELVEISVTSQNDRGHRAWQIADSVSVSSVSITQANLAPNSVNHTSTSQKRVSRFPWSLTIGLQ